MTAVGRPHHLALDTRGSRGLARFWSAVLAWPITSIPPIPSIPSIRPTDDHGARLS
jgi:hypothetical protein